MRHDTVGINNDTHCSDPHRPRPSQLRRPDPRIPPGIGFSGGGVVIAVPAPYGHALQSRLCVRGMAMRRTWSLGFGDSWRFRVPSVQSATVANNYRSSSVCGIAGILSKGTDRAERETLTWRMVQTLRTVARMINKCCPPVVQRLASPG